VTVTITNPRITASADLKLDDGTVLPVSVERGASELDVLGAVKVAVQGENMRRAAAGGQPVTIPTDDQLVTALGVLNRLANIPRSVDV
jgi:hypothetical protein